jgi:hypothetical protein
MKRALVAIILCSFATTCFAQTSSCAMNCQAMFSQCLQVCGPNCTTAGNSAAISSAATTNATAIGGTAATTTPRLPSVNRNCDTEQSLCLKICP